MKCQECKGTGEVKEIRRTVTQNNSLHLFFKLLAEALNDAGLGMREVMKPAYFMDWTAHNVKEHLWRSIQKKLYGKESTRDLNKTEEISKIHEVLMRELGEKHSVEYIPFPSKCSGCDNLKCQCLEEMFNK